MLDFIDDEYVTVNAHVKVLPDWFRHCCVQLIKYYDLSSIRPMWFVENRTMLECYFKKQGFEFEYFETGRVGDADDNFITNRGYVFKVNEALTLYMLKASK